LLKKLQTNYAFSYFLSILMLHVYFARFEILKKFAKLQTLVVRTVVTVGNYDYTLWTGSSRAPSSVRYVYIYTCPVCN